MRDTISSDHPEEIVCIECPNGCRIQVVSSESGLQYSGYRCKRGLDYATSEATCPMRTLTTSVKTIFADSPVISVRTESKIEKSKISDVIGALSEIVVTQRIRIGDIVARNVCNTGADVICTSNRLVQPY